MVEQRTENPRVVGSIPTLATEGTPHRKQTSILGSIPNSSSRTSVRSWGKAQWWAAKSFAFKLGCSLMRVKPQWRGVWLPTRKLDGFDPHYPLKMVCFGLYLLHYMMRYTRDVLESVVALSTSYSDVLRRLGVSNLSGSVWSNVKRRITAYSLDVSHFVGNKQKLPGSKRDPSEVLCLLPDGSIRAKSYQLRRALIELGRPDTCASCGMPPTWQDGNWLNCSADNLQFLCPNCHRQKSKVQKPTCSDCGKTLV
jgi:hypothetical protein